jgi:hypothetical protein
MSRVSTKRFAYKPHSSEPEQAMARIPRPLGTITWWEHHDLRGGALWVDQCTTWDNYRVLSIALANRPTGIL